MDTLEDQSHGEPYGSVVETDKTHDRQPSRIAPRLDTEKPQEPAAYKLKREDHRRPDTAAQKPILVSDQPVDGLQYHHRQPIDKKHPDRGVADEVQCFFAARRQTRPKNFHVHSQKSVNNITYKHMFSIAPRSKIIPLKLFKNFFKKSLDISKLFCYNCQCCL